MAQATEKEIIKKWVTTSLEAKLICPICGAPVYWITYAHAERHGMTRKELKKSCIPTGRMRSVRRMREPEAMDNVTDI